MIIAEIYGLTAAELFCSVQICKIRPQSRGETARARQLLDYVEPMSPASSTNRGEMVSDATSERARQLSVEKRWSQEAPVDGARSHHLPGTVYGLRILPLPAENAPRQ